MIASFAIFLKNEMKPHAALYGWVGLIFIPVGTSFNCWKIINNNRIDLDIQLQLFLMKNNFVVNNYYTTWVVCTLHLPICLEQLILYIAVMLLPKMHKTIWNEPCARMLLNWNVIVTKKFVRIIKFSDRICSASVHVWFSDGIMPSFITAHYS